MTEDEGGREEDEEKMREGGQVKHVGLNGGKREEEIKEESRNHTVLQGGVPKCRNAQIVLQEQNIATKC